MARDNKTAVVNRRATVTVAGFAAAALALAGCGVSVAAGGENAATNPASGIWESNTVGAANISGHAIPNVPVSLPPSRPPASVPSGSASTVSALKSAVGSGGCWENAHLGNYYGAYNQWFWWMGQCNDTIAMVSVELYPSAADAARESHHSTDVAVLERYLDGAVLVSVYGNAPGPVATAISRVKGLKPVPGYGYGL